MPASPKWQFFLCNSSDMSNVGEIQKATGRQIQLVFNRAGSLTFTLPLSNDMAPLIWPITSGIKAYRTGSDGTMQLVWSGFVWTIDEDISGNTMTVTAVGWLQWLDSRVLRRPKDYTANNPATSAPWLDWEIIYDLLADANTATITWDNNYVVPTPFTVSNNGSNTSMPTPVGKGAAVVGAGSWTGHNRAYKIDKSGKILDEMNKLVDLENGCDILVDPGTRALSVSAKRMTDRPAALFSFGALRGPNNLAQFSRQLDPSSMVNWLAAYGQDNTIIPQYADTKLNPAPTQNPPLIGENSQATYGLIEEVVAISDAKSAAILATYAGAEIMVRSTPRITYGITPFPFTGTRGLGRIPEPLVDYQPGDKVYLTARQKGRFVIDRQAVRVFGMTITITDNGNEQVGQLQVSPT